MIVQGILFTKRVSNNDQIQFHISSSVDLLNSLSSLVQSENVNTS